MEERRRLRKVREARGTFKFVGFHSFKGLHFIAFQDQSDGISIQNIGGVFIVIFVGIGMACVTLAFEFWYYKFRKTPKVLSGADDYNKFTKNVSMKNVSSFGSTGGLIDTNTNSTLKSRYPPAGNFRARF